MENKSKVETFIGFSIRAGKCKIGVGAVETLKRANLIVCCKTTADNTLDKVKTLAKRLGCKVYVTIQKPLEEYTHKQNSKVIAICDKSLANAIIDQSDKEIIEVGEM